MNINISDPNLEPVRQKVVNNQRLDFDDGMTLYKSPDLVGKGALADYIRRRKNGRKAYYIYSRHINYTNICTNMCLFCAFSRHAGEEGAYTLSIRDIEALLADLADDPVKELHIVGGLNPSLPFDYYIDLLRTAKRVLPHAAVKAFTAVEIDHFARISDTSAEFVIHRLMDAGLDMMPGGGAEILSDRIHRMLFPRKIDGNKWLDIVEAAHRAGLSTNATMLYGHRETIEERVAHLIKLRTLQDKTSGFSAFIPLAFHSTNTKLSDLPKTTAFDDLTNIAVARLMLDNVDHIKAYWVMIGEQLAQTALSFGADDLDGTIMDEKITHMAGAASARGLKRNQMRGLIARAGFEPVERDSFYQSIASARGEKRA